MGITSRSRDHDEHDETVEPITDEYDGLDPEYVEQCGCGGHVTRVQVE